VQKQFKKNANAQFSQTLKKHIYTTKKILICESKTKPVRQKNILSDLFVQHD
jgi:hypothetical protein